jgi:hypothetical protein
MERGGDRRHAFELLHGRTGRSSQSPDIDVGLVSQADDSNAGGGDLRRGHQEELTNLRLEMLAVNEVAQLPAHSAVDLLGII